MDNVDLEFKMYEQSKKVQAEVAAKVREEDKRKYSFAFTKELIKLGQSKEKIINFLIQVMGISKTEANAYYQEAVAD